MDEYRIDPNKLDVLKELANIGLGNAVTSLSQMLEEQKINMDVPVATVVPLQDLPDFLGGGDTPVVGIYIQSTGDVRLTILFVLSMDSASNLVSSLMPGVDGALDEMALSALTEVGNILTAAYLNAISTMTDLLLNSSPPEIALDMTGAIIAAVMAQAHMIDDEILLMKTTLNTAESQVEGNILILPDYGELEKIFRLLGIT